MTGIVALLVPAEGEARIITVDRDQSRTVSDAIGAEYVEFVRIPLRGAVMLVDDEGLYTDKATNPVSGRLYAGPIVGDVLIVGEAMTDDGLDLADLTRAQLARVTELLGIDVFAWLDLSGAHLAAIYTREGVAS